MPFTFSTETFTRPLAEFGNDAAQMILQTGATIQDGLQKMMTNRQVAGLGQELGSLNPESPEWAQKAIQLGSRYPLAMKSPAGQFMLHTQAQAHAQWQQAQTVAARQQSGFANQKSLLGLRHQNALSEIAARNEGKTGQEVDLSNLPQNGLGGRTPLPSLNPADNEPVTDEQAPLFGSMATALGPLAEAQRVTGVKPTRTQVFGAIASERTRNQQEKLQEDRQAAAAAAAAARDEARAKVDEEKAAKSEAVQQRLILQGQINTIESDIRQHRSALNAHLSKEPKAKAAGESEYQDFLAEKKQLQANLEEAGTLRTGLMEKINMLGKEESKKLDADTAAAILSEVGGDKEKARALARKRGFQF